MLLLKVSISYDCVANKVVNCYIRNDRCVQNSGAHFLLLRLTPQLERLVKLCVALKSSVDGVRTLVVIS